MGFVIRDKPAETPLLRYEELLDRLIALRR
jgi:hypothetical protein